MISQAWKFMWQLFYFGVWSWSSCASSWCRIYLPTHSFLFIDPVFSHCIKRGPFIIMLLLVHSCSLRDGLGFLSDGIGYDTPNVTYSAFYQHSICFFVNFGGEFGQSNCFLKPLLDKRRNAFREILNPFDTWIMFSDIGTGFHFSVVNSCFVESLNTEWPIPLPFGPMYNA